MANGIDWFRWHHGSVNDPKFGLVAKKAGARVGDVIAVWALVLEQASANVDRGACADLDYEATDFLLGADDGTTERIVEAMRARGLITDNRVTRWEDRQPKRERVDTTATERKRAQRERERDSGADGVPDEVTPCHATSHHVTPREEKSREEKKEQKSKTKAPAAPTFDPLPGLLAHGVAQQTANDWLALRKAKRATVTPTALNNLVTEAGKAGLSLDQALAICCTRGWAGFEADWILRDQRAGPPPDPSKAHLSKAGQATARNMEAWLERKRQEQEQGHG
ncbi:hypothetical protein SAMN05428966_10274 [Massilia sp. PDC64]|nr:hypothetical protein [Massilia sp. PDC64]SDC66783.1 hypothetical protein SAMN05428966_10274 [Massilia sp. PDC64]